MLRTALMRGRFFNPLSLFAAGEQGVWYDPSDFSTLFQDAAGTIPVTAAGQPVGMMRDKSGRGNHATQATPTSRPTLQTAGGKWFLAFDGVDDWLSTAAINFSATDKMTAWIGIRKLVDAATAIPLELSTNLNFNNGAFYFTAPNAASQSYAFSSKGSSPASAIYTNTIVAAPNSSVLTGLGDIAADSSILRVNGVQVASNIADQGTGTYGTWSLYLGRRGGASLPFNGNLYSVIVRGAASSIQQITNTENYTNSKIGAS